MRASSEWKVKPSPQKDPGKAVDEQHDEDTHTTLTHPSVHFPSDAQRVVAAANFTSCLMPAFQSPRGPQTMAFPTFTIHDSAEYRCYHRTQKQFIPFEGPACRVKVLLA